MRASAAVCVGLLLTVAGPSAFEAQTPRTLGPIAISFSGGTSKGAFQGGLVYGLFRELHPANTASPLALAPDHPIAFAGASAGNINAILGALEWCRTTPSDARSSLFFHIWNSVGLQELLGESISEYEVHRRRPTDPRQAGPDEALFTRAFFRDSLIPMVEASYDTTAVRPDCVTPIGLLLNRRTLTHLVANPFPDRAESEGRSDADLNDRGCPAPWTFEDVPPVDVDRREERRSRVRNSRFVALLGTGVRDGRLTPTSFPFATRDGRAALPPPDLGAWLTPTVDPEEPRNVQALDVTEAFDFVLASSAFPVAFAPVRLRFWAPSHQTDVPPCEGPLCRDEAEFWDGGAFDNAPVLVAHRLGCVARSLYEGPEAPATAVPASARDSVWVFSMEVNLRRPESVLDEVDTEAPVGVEQLIEVGDDFVSAARQYELQATSRFAPDVIRQTVFSSRRMPIYGERLSSFGAFISRALREIDFYIGVFEGVRFALLERLCVDPDSMEACLETELAKARARLGVDRCGEAVFDVAFREEFGLPHDVAEIEEAAAACERLAGLDARASRVVLTAGLVHLLDDTRPACDEHAGSMRIACDAGLLDFRRTLQEYAPADLDLGDEEILEALLDDPRALVDRLITIALDRAWRVADWSDSGGIAERTVNALQVVHEATGGRRIEGFELAPGLFPRAESRYVDRTAKLLPSFVRAAWEPGLAGAGMDAAYIVRLGARSIPRVALDLRPRLVVHEDASPRLKAGAALTAVLAALEVTVGWERDVVDDDLATAFLGVRGPLDLFSVEVREGGRWSVGLGDVPGAVYWALRFVR